MSEEDNSRIGSASAAWGAALLFGLLLAAFWQNVDGFLVGGALGFLLVRVAQLSNTVKQLKTELNASNKPTSTVKRATLDPQAERTQPAPTAAAKPQTAEKIPPKEPPPVYPPPTITAATPPAQQTVAQPSDTVVRTTQTPKPKPEPSPPSKLQTTIDEAMVAAKEWLHSGNPLARVGIVVLFFGGAFLAKYSADHGLFPIELRFVCLAVGALALLLFGWRLRNSSRALYSQILQGGGIAGLYLTVFAAGKIFSLLPLGLALAVLVGIAITAAILAVGQNALSLAVIGTAGGFLAPILVSTGSGNHIALFTYYAILNLGIFTVAWFRAWRVLNWVGFIFTFGITGLFRAEAYSDEKLWSTDFFLLLFFVMYVGVSILFSLRQKPDLKGYLSASLVFGLPIIVFSLHASLIHEIEFALAFSALGFGLFYGGLAYAILISKNENLKLLGEAFAALAVIFASLAIPTAFDGRTTAAMWAIEGAGMFWLGLRQDRLSARCFGLLLQIAGGIGYWVDVVDQGYSGIAVLNSGVMGGLMLATAGLVTGWLCLRHHAQLISQESQIRVIAANWGVAWWLWAGLAEIDRVVSYRYETGAALLFAAGTLVGLLALSHQLKWLLLQRIAAALLAISVVAGLVLAVVQGGAGKQLGLIAWPLLLMTGYLLLKNLDQAKDDWSRKASAIFHPGLFWTTTLLIAWESSRQIDKILAGVWDILPWGLTAAMAIHLCSKQPQRWPWQVECENYRWRIGGPLVIYLLIWITGVNFVHDGDATPLPYLPLLNPLDISIGLCALSIAGWWLSLTPAQKAGIPLDDMRFLPAGIALVGLICLSAALIRGLHHWFDIPWTEQAILRSFLVQSSLSVFWGLLGLTAILLAGRRSSRVLWLSGAGLMAVVVVKLFLVDLSGSGTLARIVSFLSVGSLLLLAGYLSPLPPANPKTAHQDAEDDPQNHKPEIST